MEGKPIPASVTFTPGQNVRGTDSQDDFQKFLYELFEKNGILNSLRAHLRSHIVEVIRNAHSGTPTQKKFTQRLELPYQALNILIVEHLATLEFNYTLSVFISEIPLANMVFDYAKSIFDGFNSGGNNAKHLRFNKSDVWSILNCLGVKCDSEFAIQVFDMYKSDKRTSLLMCILKYMPSYYKEVQGDAVSSERSSISSIRVYGPETPLRRTTTYIPDRSCRHINSCRECKKRLQKTMKKATEKREQGISSECFMRSVGAAESHIMEEMFEQIKSVYEAEVEMYKAEEEKRLKRTLVDHARMLKLRRDEMEANFKERESELFNVVNQKKKFLWGLATTLRTQHAHMSRAMMDVRAHTSLLAEKEDNLRAKLLEAEESLKRRGEEMRTQISNELQTLEQHLETLKNEREQINQERQELETLRQVCENADKIASEPNFDTNNSSNFDMLKNEISVLKQYLENTKSPKFLMETGIMTEPCEMSSDSLLNNGQNEKNLESDNRNVKGLNQVVNDLTKQKNVNFCQDNLSDLYRDFLTAASTTNETVEALKQENEHLKAVAKQQKEQIEALVRHQSELQSRINISYIEPRVWRPRTAPASLCLSGATNICHSGAGEQPTLSLLPRRNLTPDEPVPFIESRRTDSRRYLMSQWRKLRRLSPPTPKSHKSRTANKPSSSHERRTHMESTVDSDEQLDERPPKIRLSTTLQRQMSPKTMLREAKEKLRNKEVFRAEPRRSSPGALLRDAKQRLRKLEIHAEKIHGCYNTTASKERLNENQSASVTYTHSKEAIQTDYDRFVQQTHINLENSYKDYKNTIEMNKALTNHNRIREASRETDYVNIPITEFRKLYSALPEKPKQNTVKRDHVENNAKEKCTELETQETNLDFENVIKSITQKYEESHYKEQNMDIKKNNASSESNPSVSKDVTQKSDLIPSITDKENKSTELKNNIQKLYQFESPRKDENTHNSLSGDTEQTTVIDEKNDKSEDNVESKSLRTDNSKRTDNENLLRVEVNSVSEATQSLKSAKLSVVVKSSLNQGDRDENQIALVSPKKNEVSNSYNLSEDMSVGGVKDVLAYGEGNVYSDDFTNVTSDGTSPISDEENFWGNDK